MTIRAEVAAIHKAALRRNRPALIRSYVVRVLGGQSQMLGNAAENPSPTTFDAETCYAFNLTDQVSLVAVTTGTTAGVLGETRLGAVCPALDYAKRRHELIGENTIFVQLAWSGSAMLQSTTNGLPERWDPLAGESGFLTSSNLEGLNPADRAGMMTRLRAAVALSPKMDLGAIEFHWQHGHADAPSIYNGTSSASDYRAALDRVRETVKANYGVGRILVWGHGWVKQTGVTTQEVLNATHSLIHTQEDDFVADHDDVIYATLACRSVLGGNMVTNADGEWVRGGADGLLVDGGHLNADFSRAIGRQAAADVAYADGLIPAPDAGPIGAFTYTVPAAKVSSDLTAFNTYIDLGAQAPASFWENVAEDGGNIRVYDTNGVTLLPHDVIHVSPRAEIGELVVRRSITAAGGTSFKIKLLDPALAKLSNTHPAGRNAVWADYEAVYHIGHDPFDRTGRAGSLRILGDPDLLEEVATSPDVNGHEGVATDGTHYYVFDSFAIRKYDLSWSLVTQVTDIATRYDGGLGGGCVSGGVIYVAADNGGTQYLAKYRASDLVWLADHDIESFANGAADFCMVNGELHTIQWATSPGTGTIIRINPETGTSLGTIALSSNLIQAQGITFWRGAYWISVDDIDETYRVTPTGTVSNGGLFGARASTSWEGLDVAPDGDGLICMDDTGTAELVRTFKDTSLAMGMGGGAEVWADARMVADLTSAGVLGTTWTVGATILAAGTEQRYFLGVVPTGAYSATQSVHIGVDNNAASSGEHRLAIFDGSNSWQYAAGNVQVSTVAAQRVNVIYDGTASRSIFVNGGSKGTGTTITSRGTGIAHLVIGAPIENAFTDSWRGQVGFVYARKQALSDAWIAAEYSNLSNPAGFGTMTED